MSLMSMTKYDRTHPFPAKIKERYVLNKKGSTKKTYHIVLDLKGSHLSYKVGDAVGILPSNPSDLVNKLLDALQTPQGALIKDPRSQAKMSFYDFLRAKVNLLRIPLPLLKQIAPNDPLLLEENKQARSEYIEGHDLIDFFNTYSISNTHLEAFLPLFAPLLPRFYSIASSQANIENEVHLLVTTFTYQQGGKNRQGITSRFLCESARVGETPIPIYIQPTSTFTLPTLSSVPILMIGPGTGVAPYRAFLQERKCQGATGKNWLIFGERHRAYDFYYEDFLTALEKEGFLTLNTAFSRDQKEKFYVQHCLLMHAAKVWEHLESKGHVYICGDARHMAKDVTTALHQIVREEGGLCPEEGKHYIQTLRRDKRLLIDVY